MIGIVACCRLKCVCVFGRMRLSRCALCSAGWTPECRESPEPGGWACRGLDPGLSVCTCWTWTWTRTRTRRGSKTAGVGSDDCHACPWLAGGLIGATRDCNPCSCLCLSCLPASPPSGCAYISQAMAYPTTGRRQRLETTPAVCRVANGMVRGANEHAWPTEEHQRNCMLTDTPTPKSTKHHHQLIPLFKLSLGQVFARSGTGNCESPFAIRHLID